MRTEELLIILLVGGVLIVVPLVAIVLSIMAIMKTRRLNELSSRVAQMEAYLRRVSTEWGEATVTQHVASTPPSTPTLEMPPAVSVSEATLTHGAHEDAKKQARPVADIVPLPPPAPEKAPSVTSEPVGWETFIGQKAFGWVAVLLFLLATTFFLKYAYQNNWIGPIGRVVIGEMVGAALVVGGWTYLLSGWRRFSSMLMSAGIVVIYLATYSAFGFYHLLPQQHAGVFLTILVLESMVAAVYCRSAVIGMISVIGGLVTPMLLQSDHDSYTALFSYLTVLNAGVVVAICVQRWKAVGTVAFLGTHLLFWLWYDMNYHPDKFAWALGFQMLLFAIYLAQSLVVARLHARPSDREDLSRFVVNAVMGFIALRALTVENYGLWIGTAALGFATAYAVVGRVILSWRPSDNRLLLTALAVSVGFITWAIPVQADARWVSVGWAAMSFALWTFGLRIRSQVLRVISAALACLSVWRILAFDLPRYVRDPFVPVFNSVALPSLTVAVLILAGVWLADRYLTRMKRSERIAVGIAGVAGTSLLWLLLSMECHGYFVSQSMLGGDVDIWRWRAQLALTVFWTIFATLMLLAGFKLQRSRLRWLAMGLFGITVLKLFILDMANVQQIYRIVAFFVLAIVLGLVARAYQRFK